MNRQVGGKRAEFSTARINPFLICTKNAVYSLQFYKYFYIHTQLASILQDSSLIFTLQVYQWPENYGFYPVFFLSVSLSSFRAKAVFVLIVPCFRENKHCLLWRKTHHRDEHLSVCPQSDPLLPEKKLHFIVSSFYYCCRQ